MGVFCVFVCRHFLERKKKKRVMGNYISCALVGSMAARQSSRGVKVIFPDGEIHHFYQPIKAAEVMLETPGFFLSNINSLHMGRRFSALNADEDLEMGNAYVMFPMKKVSSLVTAADMGALFLTANSAAAKRPSLSLGLVRVLPEFDHGRPLLQLTDKEEMAAVLAQPTTTQPPSSVPKLNLDDIEEFATPEFKHRLIMCRSKKPVLETIAEEPFYNR